MKTFFEPAGLFLLARVRNRSCASSRWLAICTAILRLNSWIKRATAAGPAWWWPALPSTGFLKDSPLHAPDRAGNLLLIDMPRFADTIRATRVAGNSYQPLRFVSDAALSELLF
jgi:hypothetical protein